MLSHGSLCCECGLFSIRHMLKNGVGDMFATSPFCKLYSAGIQVLGGDVKRPKRRGDLAGGTAQIRVAVGHLWEWKGCNCFNG